MSHDAGRINLIIALLPPQGIVLKDSCMGILHVDKESSNLIWFQGAEAMLREAVAELQNVLNAIGR